jgi:hypothetical protein
MLIIIDVKNEIHNKSWLSYVNKIKNHQRLSQILHTIRLLGLKMLPKLRVVESSKAIPRTTSAKERGQKSGRKRTEKSYILIGYAFL